MVRDEEFPKDVVRELLPQKHPNVPEIAILNKYCQGASIEYKFRGTNVQWSGPAARLQRWPHYQIPDLNHRA